MADLSSVLQYLQGVPPQEAIPFGAGTTPQGDPTMLSNMVSHLANIPKAAIDASAYNYSNLGNHDVEPQVGPIWEAATTLAGLGAPAAESSAAGMFGGKLWKNALKGDYGAGNKAGNLDQFYDMVQRKEMPADIWRRTNWMYHPLNSNMQTEIPDTGLRLLSTGTKGPLEYQVSHSQLYANQPELRNLQFSSSVQPGDTAGVYTPANFRHPGSMPEMWVGGPDARAMREPAAHEIQHAVDAMNGNSGGASATYLRDSVNQWNQGNRNSSPLTNISDVIPGLNPSDPGGDLYRRIIGEQQAWNTGTHRLNMGSLQRSQKTPWETQDVPYSQQIYSNPKTDALSKPEIKPTGNDEVDLYIRRLMEGK